MMNSEDQDLFYTLSASRYTLRIFVAIQTYTYFSRDTGGLVWK